MPGNRPSSCALQGVKKQRFHPPHFQRQYPLSERIPRLLHLVLWNLCLDQFVPHSVKKCKKKILGMRCFPSTSYPFRMLPSTGCVSITRKKKACHNWASVAWEERWTSQRVGGGYAHFFLFIFTRHLAALRKLRVGCFFVRTVSYIVDLHKHLNREESP